MKHDDPLSELFAKARAIAPHGSPRALGLETRLLAAIREKAAPTLSESIAALSWRFSVAFLPLLVVGAILFALSGPATVPEGLGGFVMHWSSYIPIDF